MEKSAERLQFIASYITAYQEKIHLLNKRGLFDSAKMFELFAIAVGRLYLKQNLTNLNFETYAYPCVDLVSEDGEVFVQVSTTQGMPTKIKSTLEAIKTSAREEIRAIRHVKFFMLSNSSEDRVVDYTGDTQIGNISFVKSQDLITTNDVMRKAETDIGFQIELYSLLSGEISEFSDYLSKYEESLEVSKSVGLANIDSKIKDEYEVDRSKVVSPILEGEYKNIVIHGAAGSGKSVICKKIVEGQFNVIYARAERFTEETDINKIWGFNVRKTLEYLNNKPLWIFIDALEFIADNPTKLDLLNTLYELTKSYSEVRIITSCRTSDRHPFIKLENKYTVIAIEAPKLTSAEQAQIALKFPIIGKMLAMTSYENLLQIPFYINLIVSNINDIDNILDENQLRQYIWLQVICLNDNNVKDTIEKIVFDRAKNFSVGVPVFDYDANVRRKLVSKGVLIENSETIRLKYDIFEDICFEQYFDRQFESCRGEYVDFFNTIEQFGRCVYRRYQIWISNKLFTKQNREKFLNELIFSDSMPEEWRKQTKIGLIKSRYCKSFFKEYQHKIIENGELSSFIKITNLYGFEISSHADTNQFTYIHFSPVGSGRESIIEIIKENEMFLSSDVFTEDIEKLCVDYSKTKIKNSKTAKNVCFLLQYLVDNSINQARIDHVSPKTILRLLKPIYLMAEYSKDWIKSLWDKSAYIYQNGSRDERRFHEDIIEDALTAQHYMLAEYLSLELCELAQLFWTYAPKPTIHESFYFNERRNDLGKDYGLNKQADSYQHKMHRTAPEVSNFFEMLFRINFEIGLKWAVDFVNEAVLCYSKKYNEQLPTYQIKFLELGAEKTYLGTSNMWLVTAQELNMPTIISDLLYCLKKVLAHTVKNDFVENEETAEFAEHVKKYIYENANNIALLSIIADIGMLFPDKLKGYSVDLVTNIDLVMLDLQRYALQIRNPIKEKLQRDIMLTLSIPFPLNERYQSADTIEGSLIDYMVKCQLLYGDKVKERCYQIIDYLYTCIPNDEDSAIEHLQLQKMDVRTSEITRVSDNAIAISPVITGNAEKATVANDKKTETINITDEVFTNCLNKINLKEITIEECIESISKIIELKTQSKVPGLHDSYIVMLISYALLNLELDVTLRSKLCDIWLTGINDIILGGSFTFEYKLSLVLFRQIEENIDEEAGRNIKKLILDLVLTSSNNGILDKIADTAKQYLTTNNSLAKSIFNTILKLAEDEMEHQKYNAEYIRKNRPEQELDFYPNAQPKLKGVDRWIEQSEDTPYIDKKEEIIDKFLYQNTQLNYEQFDINRHDLSLMCNGLNCGVQLDNDMFTRIVGSTLNAMISVWHKNPRHTSHDIIDFDSVNEFKQFLQREFLGNEEQSSRVLELLFHNVDFSVFTSETVEFYHDVFGCLLAEYFDAFRIAGRRRKLEKIIRALEKNIESISEENIKVQLYESLVFGGSRYAGLGDWTNLPSEYSYQDKIFLNDLFKKYGQFHFQSMLNSIYKLHYSKLLPEILLSLSEVFETLFQGEQPCQSAIGILNEGKPIILSIISKAYLDYSDAIKQDLQLTRAYEKTLEALAKLNFEEAATILDEFRVH